MPGTTTNLALRYPVAGDAPDGAGAFYNLAQDVEDRFGRTASAVANLAAGTRYGQRAIIGSTEYRWNGSAWKAWESEWTAYAPSVSGVAVSSSTFLWRYNSGEIEVRFRIIASAVGGRVTIGVPAQNNLVDPSGDFLSNITFTRQGDNYYFGRCFWSDANNIFADTLIAVTKNGNQVLQERQVDGSTPVSFQSGDVIAGRFRYTPQ